MVLAEPLRVTSGEWSDCETERAQLLAAVLGDLVGPHGGSHTQLIFSSLHRPLRTSAPRDWSSMTSVSGQAADVSVMSRVTTSSSSVIPYTRPRSTTLMPSSGSTTSRIASSSSSRRFGSVIAPDDAVAVSPPWSAVACSGTAVASASGVCVSLMMPVLRFELVRRLLSERPNPVRPRPGRPLSEQPRP